MMPAALAAALALGGCGAQKLGDGPPPAPGGVTVASPDFDQQGPIPVEDSCAGAGRRPALRWSGIPAGARELAVVVTDPDAGGYVHWTVFGLAPSVGGLPPAGLPAGARQGENSGGQHRYLFDVYWLRRPSGLGAGARPEAVARALSGEAGGRGELVGRFHREP